MRKKYAAHEPWATDIGTAAGLRFVYAGKPPGRVGPWENTRCPACQATVIDRHDYLIRAYRLTPDGRSPHCQTRLPGVWPAAPTPGLRLLPLVPTVPSSPGGEPATMISADPAAARAAATPLTEEQQQHLITAVAAMLSGAVTGQPAVFPPELTELRDRPVGGAFVSVSGCRPRSERKT